MSPNPPSNTDTPKSTAEETASPAVNHSDATLAPHRLSPRERDVLQLYLDGLESKKIADQLGITDETLRTHRKHLLRKMVCHSIVQAIALAQKKGLDYFTK